MSVRMTESPGTSSPPSDAMFQHRGVHVSATPSQILAVVSAPNNISALKAQGTFSSPADNWTAFDKVTEDHLPTFRIIETCFVPLICVVGLICNSLAIKTLMHKNLRAQSSSVFLITKCIADTLFLLNLSVIYISGGVMFPITNVYVVCKCLIFITYVSGFLSVWSVIMVSVENMIRIRFPFDVKRLCTVRYAKICILLTLVVALVVYNVSLWVNNDHCVYIPEFGSFTQALVIVDSLLTLLLPTLLLIVLITAIMYKILLLHKIKIAGSRSTPATRLVGRDRKSSSHIAAVCKMLLAVSLTFFLLSVPSHTVRLYFLINAFVNGETKLTMLQGAIQGTAQLFYYASMALNLFIFIGFGENFRRIFHVVISYKKELSNTQSEMANESRNVVNRCDMEMVALTSVVDTSRNSRENSS